MEHLRLVEGAPPRRIRLDVSVARALEASEAVVVVPAPVSGEWDVVAARKIGVVRTGDLQVSIEPKVPIGRLVFLMGYARDPAFWRNDTVLVDTDLDLPEALAWAFGRLATKALEQGLLHGYVETEDTLTVLRGRIRVGAQISRHFGRVLPLEVRYDDFTADIAENRLLLATVLRLLRLTLPIRVRRILRRLRLQLADVTPLPRGMALPDWRPSRLNARYQPALRLAEVILAGNSFEQRSGDLISTGFLFDMWRIHEDFVCTALADALAPYGGRSTLQFRTHLDEAGAVAMRPDFVWSKAGAPRVVVDAKYKAEKPEGFPQADLYQMLAYCTVLGLPEGHLVYAMGSEDPATYDVRGTEVRIHAHALDLARAPAKLLAQIDELACELVAGSEDGSRAQEVGGAAKLPLR